MISVVVPLHNEQDAVGTLVADIVEAAKAFPLTEIVLVDDASADATWAVLQGLKEKYAGKVRILQHTVRSGQSAAMWTGVQAARGEVIVTLDGDGQNPPSNIPALYALYAHSANKRVMVAGQRVRRQDNFIRLISSRLANKIRAALLHDGIRDTGCSLKLFPRADYLMLPYFNHMHRYIPALMRKLGLDILTVDVSHKPRVAGVSKYGFFDRLWVGMGDLIGVFWLLRRFRPKNFSQIEG